MRSTFNASLYIFPILRHLAQAIPHPCLLSLFDIVTSLNSPVLVNRFRTPAHNLAFFAYQSRRICFSTSFSLRLLPIKSIQPYPYCHSVFALQILFFVQLINHLSHSASCTFLLIVLDGLACVAWKLGGCPLQIVKKRVWSLDAVEEEAPTRSTKPERCIRYAVVEIIALFTRHRQSSSLIQQTLVTSIRQRSR
ncbi:hypothetical protein J3R30DRAFT_46890 [Lentinula aciculospora]|uniref:Uncharacterized protein n=1 Tax=Lentinula aciculospora TaxID=153920 RepID=A0A9W9AWB3_9AGAR|nr:hypothetical protein J3R30DRAFT_46890 [Lentinula aciculospora]